MAYLRTILISSAPMADLIKYTENGLLVEVTRTTSAVAVSNSQAQQAAVKLEAAVKSIEPLLRSLQETAQKTLAETHFKSAEIKLGLSFTVEGNVFVSKVSGEANLELKLTFEQAKKS